MDLFYMKIHMFFSFFFQIRDIFFYYLFNCCFSSGPSLLLKYFKLDILDTSHVDSILFSVFILLCKFPLNSGSICQTCVVIYLLVFGVI